MTRRQVLNITSEKKRDTVPSIGSINGSSVTAITQTTQGCLWLATYKVGSASAMSPHIRNKQDVYWKGISERLKMGGATSDPFKWRRVVFQLEGGPNATGLDPSVYTSNYLEYDSEAPLAGSTAFPTNPFQLGGVYRQRRAMIPMSTTDFATFANGFFQGQSSIDFTDYLVAKVDNRIKVLSDITRSITSGNDSGVLKTYKTYIPLNKTMKYADAESGSNQAYNGYAAFNSPLNDTYVFDYFEQHADAPNQLSVTSQATTYWHEK